MSCISPPEADQPSSGMFRIREIRKAQGMNLADLSARTGIDVSLLSRIERAQSWPGQDKLILIADALNVRIHELFDTYQPKPPAVEMLAELLTGLPDESIQAIENIVRQMRQR